MPFLSLHHLSLKPNGGVSRLNPLDPFLHKVHFHSRSRREPGVVYLDDLRPVTVTDYRPIHLGLVDAHSTDSIWIRHLQEVGACQELGCCNSLVRKNAVAGIVHNAPLIYPLFPLVMDLSSHYHPALAIVGHFVSTDAISL